MLLGSRVWIGRLDIQIVITDLAEEDAIAIDAIVPHHLLDGNLPGARALLHYVLYKICITCHTKLRFVEY